MYVCIYIHPCLPAMGPPTCRPPPSEAHRPRAGGYIGPRYRQRRPGGRLARGGKKELTSWRKIDQLAED